MSAGMSEALTLALHYVFHGLAVLPLHTPTATGCTCRAGAGCTSPGKHPRTRHGVHDATDDPWQVADWWRRWPEANVGVRVPPGRVVLDVDPRSGGDATMAALLAEHGPLPATLTAETGGGGSHLWLRHDGPACGSLGPGIDVKSSTGGYVVVAPSVHATGAVYRWATHDAPAPAPEWLAARLTGPARRPRRARRRAMAAP